MSKRRKTRQKDAGEDRLSRLPKRRKIGQNDASQDRLSRLPNDVVRRILSLLPTNDAFACRSLCKAWFLAWASDPVLDFGENDTLRERRFDTQEDLVGFVDDTISKLNGTELVQTLRLCLRMYGDRALDRVENWLRFVRERNVTELDLDAVTNDIPYTLSQSVLGASSLTVLKLANLELKVLDSVALKSLRFLSLTHVKFDDESAYKLISSCSSLERLDVLFCFGSKKLRISNPNLKSLEVKHCLTSWIEVEEAKSLETLAYTGKIWVDRDFGELENLTALRLHLMSLGEAAALEGRISRLPRLEVLRLAWRPRTRAAAGAEKAIKISGQQLKHLVVDGLFHNVNIVVDAPNLISLEYDKLFVSVTSLNSPKLFGASS